jgi:cation diffusion facilitator family transporter
MAGAKSKTVIFAALAGNTAIALIKFAAAAYTGSAAMLSEAVHSVVDTGNQLVLLFGLKRAARPPTPEHPFGYGLQLYFWTFVVAVLIFGVGAVVSILHGVEKIGHPEPVQDAWVNYLVLGVGILFESVVWLVALSAFNKERGEMGIIAAVRASKDPTTFTVLFEDTAALLGLVIAMVGIAASQALNMPALDGAASVLVGVVLAATAFFLAYESHSLLTGEAADAATRAGIERIGADEPGVERVNQALTMHFGPNQVLVALSLDFRDSLAAGNVESAVSNIERAIKAEFPHVRRVFVEAQSFAGHLRATTNAAPVEQGPAAQGVARWHDCVARRDTKALEALLAEDVRFHSPFVWRAKDGKAITAQYLIAALHVLGTLTYHREASDGTTAMLEFSARIGAIELKGIDIIRFGADGRIVDFEVMVRPNKGLQALAESMQKQVAAQGVA